MELLNIEKSKNTPEIKFDSGTGELSILGRSYPEDTVLFYDKIFEWVDNYIKVPRSETTVTFNCDYFNTSSYKCFVILLKKLEKCIEADKSVSVVWFYEDGDDECKEAGEDLNDITPIPVEMKMA